VGLSHAPVVNQRKNNEEQRHGLKTAFLSFGQYLTNSDALWPSRSRYGHAACHTGFWYPINKPFIESRLRALIRAVAALAHPLH
jgi:hypothetical protein